MKRKAALPLRWDDANSGGVFALGAYRSLWWALSPFVGPVLRRRAARGKEDRDRLDERFGIGSHGRPPGTLIWVHGASVGECLAALPLIERLLEDPKRSVLVTSGTVTSAELLKQRLPPNAFHQFAPIDRRDVVQKFLDYWHPDLALFVESELWPNRVIQTHDAGIPIALVNARFSPRTYQGWRRALGAARKLFSCIDICLAQDTRVADDLKSLGAKSVRISGSLKVDSPPLPYDENTLAAFRNALGERPLFLAAQTHQGEEETILRAAKIVHTAHPQALTVLVPRHPDRGEAVAAIAKSYGFAVKRRAEGVLPTLDTQVYVADTLGELGLFYRVAKFVFLGASLVPQGGHNPLEAAILGASVLTGPHFENFQEAFDALLCAQGIEPLGTAEQIAQEVTALLSEPRKAAARGEQAKKTVTQLAGALECTLDAAEELLNRHART
jgi:3-deoxy-D-manno-octulosonic-acid transferase